MKLAARSCRTQNSRQKSRWFDLWVQKVVCIVDLFKNNHVRTVSIHGILSIHSRQGSVRLSVLNTFRDESFVSVSSQTFQESQSRVLKIWTSLGLDLVSVSFFSLHTGCCSDLVPLYMEKCLSQSLFGKKWYLVVGFSAFLPKSGSLSTSLGLDPLVSVSISVSNYWPSLVSISVSSLDQTWARSRSRSQSQKCWSRRLLI